MVAYYIAYGAYGPRSPKDPSFHYRVAGWVSGFFAIAYVLWIKSDDCKPLSLTSDLPKLITRSPEWKAAEQEMMIEQKQNPHSGPYAEYLKKKNSSSQ